MKPSERDLEKALEIVGEYYNIHSEWYGMPFGLILDCVPKSIATDICQALAAERASLPESVIVLAEYHALQGSPAAAKAIDDLQAWKAGK